MCEGVDTCPSTGLPIEQAPCHMIKNITVGKEIARVGEQTNNSISGIFQAPAGNGEIASRFFRTGWTGNR